MLPRTERINISKVKNNLSTKMIGHPLIYLRTLPSTSDLAKDAALKNAREGTVILAEAQTKGRGRFGRGWVSPPGGIWLSVILRPRIEPVQVPKITLVTSVAVAKTLGRLLRLKTEIKWPNDVLVNGKKVCGILSEAQTKEKTLEFVVVGIGINANFTVNRLPIPLRETATTLVEELKTEVVREDLLSTLLKEIESYYSRFQEGGFDVVLAECRNLAKFIGSKVKIVSQGETLEGRAIDIDEEGALTVKLKDHTLRRVRSGDLTVLKLVCEPERPAQDI